MYVRKGTGDINKDYAICPHPTIGKRLGHKKSQRCLQKSFSAYSYVEPQISHLANFTPREELVPKHHFWQMWNLHMVNFDNFGGLKSLLKFHIFIF